MKVLHLSIGKSYGGIESVIKKFINDKSNLIENFVCTRKGTKFCKELEDYNDQHYISFDFSKKSFLSDFKKVYKFCVKNDINIINTHGVGASIIAFLISNKRKNIKYVYTVHGDTDFDRMERSRFNRFIYRTLENKAMKKSDKIVAVSNDIKSKVINRKIDVNKISVIYNGLDINKNIIKIDKIERTKFISMGRLEKVKNYYNLIKAFNKLDEKYSLDIYGIGSEKDNLEKLINQLNLSKRVSLKGFDKNIGKNLQLYDYYIQPSLYETFGMALIEAIENYLPVICSNVGGMKEIIDDSTGFLIENETPDQIYETIKKAISFEKIDEIISNAYERIDKFDSRLMIKNYYDLYRSVIKDE